MRAANFLVSIGEIELMSTTILPGFKPAATPSGPNSTASTSGVSGTIRMITSDLSATSLIVLQSVALPRIESGTRRPPNTESE